MNANEAIEVLKSSVKGNKTNKEALNVLEDLVKSTRMGTKAGSITHEIYKLFEEKGPNNVTLEEATELAKSLKPDTKFDKTHLSYHRCNYRKITGDDSSNKTEKSESTQEAPAAK